MCNGKYSLRLDCVSVCHVVHLLKQQKYSIMNNIECVCVCLCALESCLKSETSDKVKERQRERNQTNISNQWNFNVAWSNTKKNPANTEVECNIVHYRVAISQLNSVVEWKFADLCAQSKFNTLEYDKNWLNHAFFSSACFNLYLIRTQKSVRMRSVGFSLCFARLWFTQPLLLFNWKFKWLNLRRQMLFIFIIIKKSSKITRSLTIYI